MADPEKAMEVENDHEDIDDEETDGVVGKSTMAAELLKNPAMFAALQGKLNSMVGVNSGYISVCIFNFQQGCMKYKYRISEWAVFQVWKFLHPQG